MSSSRAFNRSNRLNAKRRRQALRSVLPGLQDDSRRLEKSIDKSQELLHKATQREVLIDLIESQN